MAKAGTVFIIPGDAQDGVLGQITADPVAPNPHLLAAFRGIYPISSLQDREFVSPLLQQRPLILANSFDILIENGTWLNLGVFPIAETNRVYPKFRLPSIIPFMASVESYDAKRSYPTFPFLVQHIPRRFSISAKLFEDLALAANGRGAWIKKYDKILFEKIPLTRSMSSL